MSRSTLPLVALLALVAVSVHAEDGYYVRTLRQLNLSGGEMPSQFNESWYYGDMPIHIVLDGEGEAWISSVVGENDWDKPLADRCRLAFCVPAGQPVSGRLMFSSPQIDGVTTLRFTIAPEDGSSDARDDFLLVKLDHYQGLLDQSLPGSAWFRHQVRSIRQALGDKAPSQPAEQWQPWRQTGELVDTYALISGGRAMSENLQLDRVLPRTDDAEPTVAVDSIAGITVAEFDWSARIAGLSPDLDPLASLIPDDQHALFVPSFTALIDLWDENDAHGLPVLDLMQPRSEDAMTRQRYQRQLLLPMSQIARLLGPQVIASVAVTGSDPYLPTGTDLAVLFESDNPAGLLNLLLTQAAMLANVEAGVQIEKGETDGVAYTAFRSPDRAVCAYIAAVGDAVVVTNSPAQLARLIAVSQGKQPALAASPEYVFFRDRYPRSEAEETALIVISDKTIRRWCGPRWRIGTSRRTRAAAVLSELQATYMFQLAAGDVKPGPIYFDKPLPDAGDLILAADGPRSSVYGSLAFLTPIAELNLDQVTQQEARVYEQWRLGYERNWTVAFDPIAFRLVKRENTLRADLTVMPLIAGTEYSQIVDFSAGASLEGTAGDPHADALLHFVLAINKESPSFKQMTNWAVAMAPQLQVDPVGWMSGSVALYLDRDPFWQQAMADDDPQEFVENNLWHLPVAFYAESNNGLKLAAFLAGVRAFIEQSAPGMTAWETLTYHDTSYVKVSEAPQSRAQRQAEIGGDFAFYYAATGKALIISLSETVLQHAIDRQLDGPGDNGAPPWLGSNFAVHADADVVPLLSQVMGEGYQGQLQQQAFANLPILNEWRRLYPDQDPVKLHQRLWHMRLISPGGGSYEWNEQDQTMQSVIFGHPGAPKEGPATMQALQGIRAGDFGVTLDDGGLHAAIELDMTPPQP
ncbi:MAG: hypothetical protein IT445_20095 [Phycisphaeraceae bacterium]|nr:hypothetical protein [Phycisphaeraceae bacterium]